MTRKLFVTVLIFLASFCLARADQMIESVQQKLKDQGFYYGEINGKKDADTSAAIRRYQIRNGLQVTGELNAETQRSLSVNSDASSNPTPQPRATPPRETSPIREESTSPPVTAPQMESDEPDASAYAPGPRGLRPEMSGIFDGTPFEVAPPDVQRRVIIGAQSILARGGYYRSGIDGVYGPATEFAVRAYQSRVGVAATGRLDLETLAALGLLPGQRMPGFGPPRRRMFRPSYVPPIGERVYTPY